MSHLVNSKLTCYASFYNILISTMEKKYTCYSQQKQLFQSSEQQREEQRQRKLAEKQKYKDPDDTWADRFASNPYKPQALPEQPSRAGVVQDDTATAQVHNVLP